MAVNCIENSINFQEIKDKGNAYFKKSDYKAALKCFKSALKV